MPESDSVFIQGQPIDEGTHGEHDYVYSDGEPVDDSGESGVVFESGTGLGAGFRDVVFYTIGSDDFSKDLSKLGTLFEEKGYRTQAYREENNDPRIHEVGADAQFLVLFCGGDPVNFGWNSDDLDFFDTFWQDFGRAFIFTEDGSRASEANDAVDAMVGGRPFGTGNGFESGPSDGGGCISSGYPTSHPVFDGVVSIYARNSEAPVSDSGGVTSIGDVWGEYDGGESGKRMFLDGGFTRWSNGDNQSSDDYRECDNQTMRENGIDWLTAGV